MRVFDLISGLNPFSHFLHIHTCLYVLGKCRLRFLFVGICIIEWLKVGAKHLICKIESGIDADLLWKLVKLFPGSCHWKDLNYKYTDALFGVVKGNEVHSSILSYANMLSSDCYVDMCADAFAMANLDLDSGEIDAYSTSLFITVILQLCVIPLWNLGTLQGIHEVLVA